MPSVAKVRSSPLDARHSAFATETEPAALTIAGNGQMIDANEAARYLFGYSQEQLEGFHVSLLLPTLTQAIISHESRFSHFRYLAHCGVGFKAVKSDGSEFCCALSVVPFQLDGESVVHLVVSETESDVVVCP